MKKYFSGLLEVFHVYAVSESNHRIISKVGCVKLPKQAKPLVGVSVNGNEGYMMARTISKLLPVTRVIAYKDSPSLHVCDARCENATGNTCECSCGGMNHGINRAIGTANIVQHLANSPE